VATKTHTVSNIAAPPSCFAISEFCERNHLSLAFFYKLRQQGLAPVEMEVGRRRFVSVESEAAWRHDREQRKSG
jgi:hypothetical protein